MLRLIVVSVLTLIICACGTQEESVQTQPGPGSIGGALEKIAAKKEGVAQEKKAVETLRTLETREKVAEKIKRTAQTSILTVVMENKYKKVLLPHLMHAELMECSLCHGLGAPGKVQLSKREAHHLCRDCHQEEQAGPTRCSECHVR